MTKEQATAAFNATDKAWGKMLRDLFGKDAHDARYDARGRGEPGSPLRAAYCARMAAYQDYTAAWRH